MVEILSVVGEVGRAFRQLREESTVQIEAHLPPDASDEVLDDAIRWLQKGIISDAIRPENVSLDPPEERVVYTASESLQNIQDE